MKLNEIRELLAGLYPSPEAKKINELVREMNRLRDRVSTLEIEGAAQDMERRKEIQALGELRDPTQDNFSYDDGPLWKFARELASEVGGKLRKMTEGQKRLNSAVYGKRDPWD